MFSLMTFPHAADQICIYSTTISDELIAPHVFAERTMANKGIQFLSCFIVEPSVEGLLFSSPLSNK